MNIIQSLIPHCCLLCLALFGAAPSHAGNISTDPSDWVVLRDTVTLSVKYDVISDISSTKSLYITGRFSDCDASAMSDAFPMEGFGKYRFSAAIRVDRFDAKRANPHSNIPLPYLRCEFLTDDPNAVLGSCVIRNAAWKWGKWHRIAGEFRAPWGTTHCRIVIADDYAKWGKNIPYDVDILVGDIAIEPLVRFTAEGIWRLAPPQKKRMTGNSHPHLYLTQNGIDRLKKIITGTHAELWREIREQADGLLTREPPEWRITAADTYDEQWWMSNNGPAMITLSLAWHMTGEEKYLDGARKWALATCDYPSWGTGWAANIDCMTGHNLYGLAVTYDWLYRDLDKNSLATIRQTLVKRASLVFDRAASGTIVPSKKDFSTRPWPEWEEVWLQNHLWVNATGLLATGLALIDETPAAEEWAAFAIDRFIRTMQYLGPDGASHEGINYWGYGVEHLLKSMYLMRDCADIDLFNGDWLRNAAFYRMHMSIPRNAWKINSISVNYGDSHPRDASGPDHILRALAAEFNDPHAQRFARLLDESNTVHASNRWLNLLWYDPAIPEKAIDEVPTFAHFSDQGIVTSRSGWAGDESFLFFKCGSYIGHHALEAMNYCASSAHHTHPDQNGFMLFADGEWLMRDDGNYGKYTGQHNTLIIDGGEQLGGGDSIFDGSRLHALKRAPKIITADSTPGYDHMAGDARAAYPPETGLTKFVRHLIHLKRDNALVIADDIVLDEARDLELRFHPGPQTAERDGNMFTAQTASGSTMRWEALATDDVAVSSYTHDLIDRRYNKSVMLAFSVKKHGKKMRNVAVVSWGKATTSGHKPAVTTSEDEFLISTDNARLKFDWNTGTITEK